MIYNGKVYKETKEVSMDTYSNEFKEMVSEEKGRGWELICIFHRTDVQHVATDQYGNTTQDSQGKINSIPIPITEPYALFGKTEMEDILFGKDKKDDDDDLPF